MDTTISKEKERKDLFFNELKKRVYEGELIELNNFAYSCFEFNFDITEQQYLKEFANFLYFKEILLPWDIVNFFIQRNLEVSISFKYNFDSSFKTNFTLFKVVVLLKKELFLLKSRKFISKFINSINKTMNNILNNFK